MMVVRIQTSPSLSLGTPTLLFESRGYRPSVQTRNWDVNPDGRFLQIQGERARRRERASRDSGPELGDG